MLINCPGFSKDGNLHKMSMMDKVRYIVNIQKESINIGNCFIKIIKIINNVNDNYNNFKEATISSYLYLFCFYINIILQFIFNI